MRREPVASSVLKSVGYDDSVLELEFVDGDVYRYFVVPRSVHRDLMASASPGRYFTEHIRDRYPYEED